MLTTPFGKIKIYADGVCTDYEATEYDFNRPPCKDEPISACYRIETDARQRKTVSCVLEPDDRTVQNTGDSGQNYLNAEFIRENVILTIGMEDENPNFESVRLKYGLQYKILSPTPKVVFGIAWTTDYKGIHDVRTWYAADPTIIIKT